MPYCSQCGVEIDKHIKKCPLCSTPIQQLSGEPEITKMYPENAAPASRPPVSLKQPLSSKLLFVSFLFLLPLVLITTVDLLLSGTISWSFYPVSALGEIWIISFFILLFRKKPVIYIPVITLSVLILKNFFIIFPFEITIQHMHLIF